MSQGIIKRNNLYSYKYFLSRFAQNHYMNVEEIIVEITPLFWTEFHDKTLVVKPEMTAADVENWDSITNVQLIVAIENKYKIRFTSKEIQDFKNVGEICESIIAKTAK